MEPSPLGSASSTATDGIGISWTEFIESSSFLRAAAASIGKHCEFVRLMRAETGNLTTVKIGMLGASGYAGIEQLKLSSAHPKHDVFHVTGDAKAGVRTEMSEILCVAIPRRGSILKPG
jgi:hypothetical protein